MHSHRVRGLVAAGSFSACIGAGVLLATDLDLSSETLPTILVPVENPATEEKRILGKILFWDEQLSGDNATACGTCHMPGSAGADPVAALHPGADEVFGTPDDLQTSFGVHRSDALEHYEDDPVFGYERQTTGRAANPAILAQYAEELFWDGRATSEFVDPETGDVLIASGGALESQAVGPVLSDVEMAHEERDWTQVSIKLETVEPLGLASDLPDDVATALETFGSYPELFERTFDTPEINAARIAFAIATYERTLIADQTPWDRFMLGDTTALTPQQLQGWQAFEISNCAACHTPPLFTDNSFRNIAVRPANQDTGRAEVTGDAADRGRFKVPTLRNVGLKTTYMHTGSITDLPGVMAFYRGPGAPGNARSPLLPTAFAPNVNNAVIDFMANALTDPRVANEEFPFDRPTLRSEMPTNIAHLGGGTAGTGGAVPAMIASVPPALGDVGFKVGVHSALPGASAELMFSLTEPVAGALTAPAETVGPMTIDGSGGTTAFYPLPADASLDGSVLYVQWAIDDPSAADGVALSEVVALTLFCGTCAPDCPADLATPTGTVDIFDVLAYLSLFSAEDPGADLAEPQGTFDIFDVLEYLQLVEQGCA